MTIKSLSLSLKIGPSIPVPQPELAQALQAVQVTQKNETPSGFQLTFHTEQLSLGVGDYAVARNPLLMPFNRVFLSVTSDGVDTPLIDGYITHQQFVPSDHPTGSSLVVTGEDLSVKMDMVQFSLEYPAAGDAAIALAILTKYALFGVKPDVQPTVGDLIPFGYVPQQNCTDLEYLKQLAQQNGNYFYLTPISGDSTYTSSAYWGPPVLSGTAQPTLNVNTGPSTNVQSIQFSYNSLAPTFVYGYVMETEVDPYVPVPVVTVGSTRSPALSTEPALSVSKLPSFSVKEMLWQDQGMNPIKSLATAQGITDLSTDEVVTAQGQLSVTRYGAVLTAPGLVGVRGAGELYDGIYYVKSVTHQIDLRTGQWNYQQSFVLVREGTGTTTQNLPA